MGTTRPITRENVGMFHVVLYYIQNHLNEVLYTHNFRTASYGCMALMLLRIHVFVRLPRCYDCNKLGRSIDGVQTACFNQGIGDAFQAWLRFFFYLLQSVQTRCGLYLVSYPLDTGNCLPALKRSKREGNPFTFI